MNDSNNQLDDNTIDDMIAEGGDDVEALIEEMEVLGGAAASGGDGDDEDNLDLGESPPRRTGRPFVTLFPDDDREHNSGSSSMSFTLDFIFICIPAA